MANQELLELLQQSAAQKNKMAAWNRWRSEHGDISPDLGKADLSGVDLSGANLDWTDLRDANLRDAKLSGAHLRDADLGGANLGGASLIEAKLEWTDLRGADLSRADISGAKLSNADLRMVNLVGGFLVYADLLGANLRDANLSDAKLYRAELRGANLVGANLGTANLTNADLHEANLSDADLHKANFSDADLSNANLSNANLSNANLSNTNLRGANLRGADLRSAILSGASGIQLLSASQLAQLGALALASSLALLLWTLLDLTIHWTAAFPWLGGSIGVLMATGAILFLLLGRPTQNNPWAVRPLIRNGVLALFPFIAGVSHIYQSLFLWYGGFTGAGADYLNWLAYQLGWVVDILLFNVFDVYAIPVSPIRPQALWAQTVVFALNLILVAIVLGATFNAYNEFQTWRGRIKSDL